MCQGACAGGPLADCIKLLMGWSRSSHSRMQWLERCTTQIYVQLKCWVVTLSENRWAHTGWGCILLQGLMYEEKRTQTSRKEAIERWRQRLGGLNFKLWDTKDFLEPWEAQKRAGRVLPCSLQREHSIADTWLPNFSCQNYGRIHFCSFQPRSYLLPQEVS